MIRCDLSTPSICWMDRISYWKIYVFGIMYRNYVSEYPSDAEHRSFKTGVSARLIMSSHVSATE